MNNEPSEPDPSATPVARRGNSPTVRSGNAQGGLGRSLPEIFDLVPRATTAAEPAAFDQELMMRELGALRHDLRAIEERLVHLMIDLAHSVPSTGAEPQRTKPKRKAKRKRAKQKARKH